MKTMLIASAALAAFAASAAAAHPGPGQRAEPLTRAAVEARVEAGFDRVDANRDGFVTREEARASRAAFHGERREAPAGRRAERFARLDADRDGTISRAEFDAPRFARAGDRAERGEARMARRGERRTVRGGQGGLFARLGGRRFEAADTDRDGRVTREEARSGALALFARVDANRDGTISLEERRAAREAFRARRAADRG